MCNANCAAALGFHSIVKICVGICVELKASEKKVHVSRIDQWLMNFEMVVRRKSSVKSVGGSAFFLKTRASSVSPSPLLFFFLSMPLTYDERAFGYIQSLKLT